MIEQVKKYLENRSRFEDTCEQVVGGRVEDIATIWRNNKDLFQIIEAYLILSYSKQADYTSEESRAYRLGVVAINSFLEACENEVQLKIRNKNMKEEA